MYGRHDSSSSRAPEREPEMRPEELVRRADEDVDVPGGDVDRAVRCVVDGVRPGERARLVRERDDPRHVRRRPDRVRGDRKRDHARPLADEPGEVVVVEREVVGHAGGAHDDPEVVRELEPGSDVPVVVELRHDHLVALAERARERPRQQEVERGHARAERDLGGGTAEERGGAGVRSLHELVRAPARLVGRVHVRVRLAEVRRDRVDHRVRALRAAGRVEERERPVERGEPRPNCADVECGGAHAISSPFTVHRYCGRRDQRVADEAAALGSREQLLEILASRRGGELDLEARLDLDEGVQTVLVALPDDAVSATRAGDLELGLLRVEVEARQRAADECDEHEVLRPPLVSAWDRHLPRDRSSRCARRRP